MNFIIDYARANRGPTPTIKEIAQHFGLHYSTTYQNVLRLVKEGRLRRNLDNKLVVPGARWIPPRRFPPPDSNYH